MKKKLFFGFLSVLVFSLVSLSYLEVSDARLNNTSNVFSTLTSTTSTITNIITPATDTNLTIDPNGSGGVKILASTTITNTDGSAFLVEDGAGTDVFNVDTATPRLTSAASIYPGATATYDLGTSGARWRYLYLNNQLFGGNGSVNAPLITFSGDTNTGMYWVSADVLGFTAGGTNSLSIGASAITVNASMNQLQGADVASANSLTLSGGNAFEITGTTQVNAVATSTWQNGSMVTLLFTSNPTVKHNTAGAAGTAVLLLAGGIDFSATAGDTLTLILSEIGGAQAWREVARTAI